MLKPLPDKLFTSLIQVIFLFCLPSAINGIGLGLGQKATLRESATLREWLRYAIALDSRFPTPDSRLPIPVSC
ncbi:MAG: hypothetical protein F6K65_11815 [Moorea sp. SIO3C2]|nr:hypothetical protein [Moorena sp. SIO3C2]